MQLTAACSREGAGTATVAEAERGHSFLYAIAFSFKQSDMKWNWLETKTESIRISCFSCFFFFVFSIANCNNKKIILQVDPAWTIPYCRPYPIRISTAMNNPIRVSLPTWRPDARVSSIRFASARLIHFLDIFSGWHYCDIDGRQASFLCPNGTQFSQAVFVCDWWFNVRCDLSPRLYAINARLYQRPKVNPTRPHRIITKQLVEDIFTWSAQLSVSIYIYRLYVVVCHATISCYVYFSACRSGTID